MFGGMVAVLVQAVYAVGGIENMWDLNMEWGRLDLFDFDLDPTKRITFWSGVFGNALTVLCIYGTQQSGYQRYSSLPTQSKATWSMLGMVPGNVLMQSLACLCGLAMFAYYANIGCDPKHTGIITSYNQLMPYFVSAIFSYPVIPGLFIAALFAASLSLYVSERHGGGPVERRDRALLPQPARLEGHAHHQVHIPFSRCVWYMPGPGHQYDEGWHTGTDNLYVRCVYRGTMRGLIHMRGLHTVGE